MIVAPPDPAEGGTALARWEAEEGLAEAPSNTRALFSVALTDNPLLSTSPSRLN